MICNIFKVTNVKSKKKQIQYIICLWINNNCFSMSLSELFHSRLDQYSGIYPSQPILLTQNNTHIISVTHAKGHNTCVPLARTSECQWIWTFLTHTVMFITIFQQLFQQFMVKYNHVVMCKWLFIGNRLFFNLWSLVLSNVINFHCMFLWSVFFIARSISDHQPNN